MGSSELPKALARDPDGAPLPEADRAMVDYALKLTRTPGAMDSEDVDRLRRAGFSDRAILDICQITAYFNYVNRLADGLGVELEDRWSDEELTIRPADLEARRAEGAGDP